MATFVHALSEDLWVLGNELDTLLDVLLEILQACVQQLLLVVGQLADIVDLLDTIWAERDLGSEEVDALVLVEWAVNEGWLDDVRLALSSSEQALGESSTSHSHGEGGRTSTILGLDDLVTTKLNSVDESVELLAGDIGVAGLRDQWDDGDTGVTTNNGNVLVGWVSTLD